MASREKQRRIDVQRQLFLPVDDNYSCRFTFCALRCCATLVR